MYTYVHIHRPLQEKIKKNHFFGRKKILDLKKKNVVKKKSDFLGKKISKVNKYFLMKTWESEVQLLIRFVQNL